MGCTTHAGFQSSEKQWIEGPRHVLLHLQLHKQQKKIVHDIVMPTVKRSAWHAYIWWDDNTIPSLFMAIRRGEQWREQQSTETKGTKHWTHCKQHCGSHWLVGSSWALSDIYIPPCTLKIKGSLNEPMLVPQWPCYTKSIERLVNQVTEMSGTACSHKKRECVRRAAEVGHIIMQ